MGRSGGHMTGTRKLALVAAVLVIAVTSTKVSAISPSAVMVYGENAGQPTLLRPASPADFHTFGLLWWQGGPYNNPRPIDPELLTRLKARPYVNLAIFWGQYDVDQFKPEHASQHGRFYPPTATEPAIVVSTVPDMQNKSNPIPSDLERFAAAWTLSPQDLSALTSLGFPSSWK